MNGLDLWNQAVHRVQSMHVQYIEGHNFRDIPDFSLNLHNRLNVFVGSNGSGKSSILSFVALLLS